MGVMHIPGHDNQAPREVSLDEIRAVLGDCRLCPLCETITSIKPLALLSSRSANWTVNGFSIARM